MPSDVWTNPHTVGIKPPLPLWTFLYDSSRQIPGASHSLAGVKIAIYELLNIGVRVGGLLCGSLGRVVLVLAFVGRVGCVASGGI